MQTVADEFQGATVQERFLIMMHECIGKMQEEMHGFRGMLANITEFITTAHICTVLRPPADEVIDAAYFDQLIEAVQKTPRISVDALWAINRSYGGQRHHISVYVQLKERVMVQQVSREMIAQVSHAFQRPVAMDQWAETCLRHITDVTTSCNSEGSLVHPVLFHARYP